MKRIAMIGVYKDNNLGDPLVFDCNRYMIENASDEGIIIEYFDFMARKEIKPFVTPNTCHIDPPTSKDIVSVIRSISKRFLGYERITAISQKIRWLRHKAVLEKYYDNAFSKADMALIAGAGTIKWGIRRDYSRYYGLVEKYATKYHIPVIVSSAGVEDSYDDKDQRCVRFSKILSSDCFKIVTTRDNITELKKLVTNSGTDVARVSDFGIFASDAYGITKYADSDCIGIGIIASSRFQENKKNISPERYKSIIFEIVDNLNKQGQRWKFFTNGGLEDSSLAIDFCKQLDVDSNKYLVVPTTPKELVKTIGQFRGIITARLHSCIVAYSLDVPFIVMSWNDKVTYFSRYAGCPERVITAENMNSKHILNSLRTALDKGFDQTLKGENRKVALEYAKKYVEILHTC